ncbi:MAG: hypothetical protein IKW89_12945 [Bacteroidales bacterium]|nr:hypothetical protein [Bacteroidales bacterium]
MKKKNYGTPCVLKQVTVQLEASFLQGSVVEKRLKVETAGHETKEHDFNETGFNTEWK